MSLKLISFESYCPERHIVVGYTCTYTTKQLHYAVGKNTMLEQDIMTEETDSLYKTARRAVGRDNDG